MTGDLDVFEHQAITSPTLESQSSTKEQVVETTFGVLAAGKRLRVIALSHVDIRSAWRSNSAASVLVDHEAKERGRRSGDRHTTGIDQADAARRIDVLVGRK